MRTLNRRSMAVAAVVALTLSNAIWAADPAPTTITVPDMHCGGCAKKVAAKLLEVAGVAKASQAPAACAVEKNR